MSLEPTPYAASTPYTKPGMLPPRVRESRALSSGCRSFAGAQPQSRETTSDMKCPKWPGYSEAKLKYGPSSLLLGSCGETSVKKCDLLDKDVRASRVFWL